nr:MAG TPA: hypothetical protein [Caudoviricetes sp.]DAW28211.1 MAG TPA: hypothetical protein [Caudoviricetes sp.]
MDVLIITINLVTALINLATAIMLYKVYKK